jgi:hypothetical protein
MRGTGGDRVSPCQGKGKSRRRALFGAIVGSVFAVGLMVAPGASAAGYDFAGVTPTGASSAGGVIADPVGDTAYVMAQTGPGGISDPGFISKFDCSDVQADEACEAGTPATLGSLTLLLSIALNPAGHLNTVNFNLTSFATEISGIDPSSGATDAGYPFATTLPVAVPGAGQSATDSSGKVYVPFSTGVGSGTIEVFDPSAVTPGTPVESIDCEACPGGVFEEPRAVAIDSSDNLYVADTGNERIVKVPATGTPSVPISAVATQNVAVNDANGNIFVGGNDGDGFHVTEYTGAGVEVAEFGAGTLVNKESRDQIAVNSATGDVYVADNSEAGTDPIGLLYVFSPIPPVQPAATTTPASSLTQTAATLNGTVNPNEGGAITSCEFEWGTTTAYSGGTVPCASNPPDGNSPVAVTGALSGLSPNTTYHYQLVVDNGGQAVKGGDQTLKTLPPPAKVTTEAATGTGQGTATLNATVDAEGDDAFCSFEYGPSAAYGKTAACSINPVTGTAPTAVSAALSGLAAGTTYHFRVVATNGAGPIKGTDLTFATAAAPSPPAGGGSSPPPATTPPATTPPPAKKPIKCKKGFKRKTVKGKAKCVKVKKHHKKKH